MPVADVEVRGRRRNPAISIDNFLKILRTRYGMDEAVARVNEER
ncbi:hypothetical protein AB0E69_11845 [Kribbella sp. NPDC026611]